MALPKKGLRKLDYEGNTYGWKIGKRPDNDNLGTSPITVAIQQMDVRKTQVLYARLSISYVHMETIGPAYIIDIIDEALDKGWKPDAGGKTFEFDCNVKV